MARIFSDTYNFELSYIDLCQLLKDDIEDDECMPEGTKKQAIKALADLVNVITPYSA